MAIGRITISADKLKVSRIAALAAAAYALFVMAFYFLAGEQLHYRASRYNIVAPVAESAVVELTEGIIVEQNFTAKLDRMQEISVQWATYYRDNSGTVTMTLVDARNGSNLLSQEFDASAITDGGITVLSFAEPMEDLNGVPLILRLTADSQTGSAVAPLMATLQEGASPLTVDGTAVQGILCLSASGQEFIWAGLHYWEFAAALGVVIALFLLICYRRWRKGEANPLVNAILAMKRYRFLIEQLVNRDFKTKYKRSVLGVFWSFLNPLLTMVVQYVVFSQLFRFDIPHYPVYLLAGIVMFNYFSEACGLTLGSITGNAALITKVYVPKYIYPLTRVLSSLINLLIAMIPLLLVSLISGLRPTKAYILAIYSLVCVAVFCLGLGMLLATSMVFFRDTQFLWGVLSMIWMYLTPIFYPASILPQKVAWVLKVNPMYFFVDFLRTCIIDGVSPEPRMYVICAVYACAMLLLGVFVFKKNQDDFVLYL